MFVWGGERRRGGEGGASWRCSQGQVPVRALAPHTHARREITPPHPAPPLVSWPRMLQGPHARREVSDIVNGLQQLAEVLPLPEDRLLAFVEGAQVGGVGTQGGWYCRVGGSEWY